MSSSRLGTGGAAARGGTPRQQPMRAAPQAQPTTAEGRTERRATRQAALAYNTNGQAYFKSGEYAKAAELFTQALSLHPDNPRYFFARANCYRNLGDNQRCLFDYSMAIRLEPTVAQYYANRGTIFRKLGRLDDALSDLKQAVSMDPTNSTYCFNRALVFGDMGEAARAVGDFTAAIELGADGPHAVQTVKAHFHRGALLHTLGRYREAAADQRIVLRTDKNNAPALNALALALAALGELSEALPLYDQAIRLDMRTPAYPANRAAAFRALARFPDALADLGVAIELSGVTALPLLRAQLGETLIDCGDISAAAGAFAEAVRLDGSNAELRLAYGRALYLLGELGDARAQLELALGAEPKLARAHYQIGLVFYQAGAFAEALGALDRAAVLDAASDAPHIAAAAVLLDTAEPTDALARLNHAVALHPDSVGSRLLRGRALVALGGREGEGSHAVDPRRAAEALADLQVAIVLEAREAEQRRARDARAEAAVASAQSGGSGGGGGGGVVVALTAEERRGRRSGATAPGPGVGPDDDAAALAAASLQPGTRPRAEPNPLRAELFGQRALVLHALGEHARALSDLELALEMRPDDPRWLEVRALCHARQRNLTAALADLDAAIECAGRAVGGAAHALASSSTPAIAAALAAADVAHLLAPAAAFGERLVARLRHQRAAVQFCRERYRASATELTELLAPEHVATLERARRPAAAFVLGLCHAREGRHLAAVESLNDAVAARPDVPVYRHERAKALQLAREHAAAVHDFSAVLAAQPDNARARFRRGFAHKALGSYEKAADDFEGAKLLAPRAPELVLNYAHIHAIDTIELCAPGDEPDTPPLIF
ncbi:hypothetical protein KFE25_014278 [Diacronema lutheri]|uniref:UDP-N-acetylglucosamine--peptide N-acetylglucosaminyltransferase SPINDLY n=1 Tax=Diacronema lutheri TaxID=2081491 RepID=A0A8J6CA55_DIALT|nr:hypothetical protein KFE25_014278 [Diacronema lutheri]